SFRRFKNLLGPGHLIGILGVYRDEDVTFLQLALVALCLDLGYAHSDETSRDATHRGSDGGSAECGENGTGSDEGTNSRNRERADSGEPAQRSPDDPAGSRPGDSSFGRFGVSFVCKVPGRAVIGEEGGNVVAGEIGKSQLVDDVFRLGAGGGQTNNGALRHNS